MEWPDTSWVGWGDDGSAVLTFRRRRRELEAWQALKATGRIDGRFDGYFRVWRVTPRTQLGRVELLWYLQELSFKPWPAENLIQMLNALDESDRGIQYYPDTYVIPRGTAVENQAQLVQAAACLGSAAHFEWGSRGLQIMTRRSVCHVLIRTLLLELGVGINAKGLESFQPLGW